MGRWKLGLRSSNLLPPTVRLTTCHDNNREKGEREEGEREEREEGTKGHERGKSIDYNRCTYIQRNSD